jgi:pimeloyl-ACP methyl ester carboxylesterase
MLVLLWAFALTGFAQSVQTLQWPTKYAAKPPTNLDARWLATFRVGLSSITEAQAVGLSGPAAQALGLPQEQAGRLQRLLVPLYDQIKQDDVFKSTRSALPFCYSEATPTNGFATVYFPEKLDTNKAPIIFLHGYGGSFLWPVYLLARTFPDRLIIAPAYGLSGANIHPLYLQQAMRATQEALKLDELPGKPVLIGLSAGGTGVMQIYGARAINYTGAICLATYPPSEMTRSFRAGHKLGFICGSKEFYVQNQMLAKGIDALQQRGASVTHQVLKNADHFFFAEFPLATEELLQAAVKRLETEK